jgi:hypothetical protein
MTGADPGVDAAVERIVPRDPFDGVRAIADAVLYEGYVLYPYRASSSKNQTRWQFGVLMPPAYVDTDSSERDAAQTEILFEAPAGASLRISLRFLHVQHRTGGGAPDWDEAIDRQLEFSVPVDRLRGELVEQPFRIDASVEESDGVRREVRVVEGAVIVRAVELPGPYGALRLHCVVENRTAAETRGVSDRDGRDDALRTALVAAHTLYALDRGRFVSMTDPPEWARPEVAACDNVGTWPVLAGSDRVVLSSPIILGDHPEIAPESPGELYDGTEIDEILTLRTMTLTDAEKAEARATDPRAAALIDRVDGLPPEQLDRLHGALRYLRNVTGEGAGRVGTGAEEEDEPETIVTPGGDPMAIMTPSTPWWDPGSDASVSPETDSIIVDGVRVARGSRVRLRPGARRTDAQDLFMRGKTATVEAVLFDVDGQQHVGVTPDEDPELAEIQRWHGRFLYFAPDEIEPLPTKVSP